MDPPHILLWLSRSILFFLRQSLHMLCSPVISENWVLMINHHPVKYNSVITSLLYPPVVWVLTISPLKLWCCIFWQSGSLYITANAIGTVELCPAMQNNLMYKLECRVSYWSWRNSGNSSLLEFENWECIILVQIGKFSNAQQCLIVPPL